MHPVSRVNPYAALIAAYIARSARVRVRGGFRYVPLMTTSEFN